MSPAEKKVCASLRRAEVRRQKHLSCRVLAFACKGTTGTFGIPFFSASAQIALDGLLKMCPSGVELYHIGYFFTDDASLQTIHPKLVTSNYEP